MAKKVSIPNLFIVETELFDWNTLEIIIFELMSKNDWGSEAIDIFFFFLI